MEKYSLFGIPYPLIGFFCFILASIFIFVWPKSKIKNLKDLSLENFILHYFHPLAWVIVGLGAFFQKNSPETSIIFLGSGFLIFLMFLFIYIKS